MNEYEKLLNEQMDGSRKETSGFRVTNAKLASQPDNTKERLKTQQVEVESYKKEITSYIDKNPKFAANVRKQEQIINTLYTELLAAQSRLSASEDEKQTLNEERTAFDHAGKLLLNEIRSQKRSEFEMKTWLTNRIENFDKENAGKLFLHFVLHIKFILVSVPRTYIHSSTRNNFLFDQYAILLLPFQH